MAQKSKIYENLMEKISELILEAEKELERENGKYILKN